MKSYVQVMTINRMRIHHLGDKLLKWLTATIWILIPLLSIAPKTLGPIMRYLHFCLLLLHCTLARKWNQPRYPSIDEWKNTIHVQNVIYFNHKEKWNHEFAGKWMKVVSKKVIHIWKEYSIFSFTCRSWILIFVCVYIEMCFQIWKLEHIMRGRRSS